MVNIPGLEGQGEEGLTAVPEVQGSNATISCSRLGRVAGSSRHICPFNHDETKELDVGYSFQLGVEVLFRLEGLTLQSYMNLLCG